jgi:hypothetical protein
VPRPWRRALAIAEDVTGVTALDECRLVLLRSLMRVAPSDLASLNDLGPDPDDVAVVLMRVHHQIAFTLASSPTRMLAIAPSRAESDFTDAERDLLDRVRPLLITAFRALAPFAQRTWTRSRLVGTPAGRATRRVALPLLPIRIVAPRVSFCRP